MKRTHAPLRHTMHPLSQFSPVLLHAPDGGLPGIPGSGPSGGSGLPGIPGSAPAGSPEPSTPTTPLVQPTFSEPQSGPAIPAGPVSYELSGWWRRVGAYIIDGILLGVVTFPLIALLGIGTTSTSSSSAEFSVQGGAFLVAILVGAAVSLLYAPITMVTFKGSTLGKLATGIRVVRADGNTVTFGYAALREVVVKGLLFGIIGALTFGLGQLINYLWPLWDAENRALHDMMVKSRVVRR